MTAMLKSQTPSIPSTAIDENPPSRKAAKRYDDKVVKLQVVFNPEKEDEVKMIQWVRENTTRVRSRVLEDGSLSFSTLVKQLLAEHIDKQLSVAKKPKAKKGS